VNHYRLSFIFLALLLAVLACNLPAGSPSKPLITQPTPLEPVANPTVTAEVEVLPPSPLPTATLPPPATDIPLPSPTEAEPSPEVPEGNKILPNGFITGASDGSSITFYGLQGQPLGVVQTTGMSSGGLWYVHVAGGVLDDPSSVPLVYMTYENQGNIKQSLNGNVSILVAGPDVACLRGALGKPVLAYTVVTWDTDTDALISHLFVGNLNEINTAPLVLEHTDPMMQAVLPLALRADDEKAQGVWYTLEPWGIGGDIVFPPNGGLFYLDLDTGGSTLHLTEDFNPAGISPDQSWVVYSWFESEGEPTLTLYNLDTTVMVKLPLDSSSDRGAGYAVISPDNHYVAWMEGSGWQMAEQPNFVSRVRIANSSGEILADVHDTIFSGVTALGISHWVKPVGWLDNENLIVEVRGEDWNQVSLVRVKYDGSDLAYLVSGVFAGFTYP
jgi:hypothetical protein